MSSLVMEDSESWLRRRVLPGHPFGHHWTRGWHRAEFYHRHGFVSQMPSMEQFRVGTAFFMLRPTLGRAIAPFGRRLFSRESWTRAKPTASDPGQVLAGGTSKRYDTEQAFEASSTASWDGQRAPSDPVEALLAKALKVDVLRALLIHSVCPIAVTAGLGFEVGSTHIVNHCLMSPHPCEHMTWDVQLIHSDPGGLDLFAARLEQARKRKGLRGRILHSLGTLRGHGSHLYELVRQVDEETGSVSYVDATTADGAENVVLGEDAWQEWYDHVADTIARARRFEYAKCEYPAPSIPEFVNLCAQLEPGDYEFFQTRNVFKVYPEIDWPRADPRPLQLRKAA